MKVINLDVKPTSDFSHIAQQAFAVLPKKPGGFSMIGWYDKSRRTGGPMEACHNEPLKCARDYARSHNGEYEVTSDGFEFYFAPVSPGTEQLDPEMVIQIHRDLNFDYYENLQGG